MLHTTGAYQVDEASFTSPSTLRKIAVGILVDEVIDGSFLQCVYCSQLPLPCEALSVDAIWYLGLKTQATNEKAKSAFLPGGAQRNVGKIWALHTSPPTHTQNGALGHA
jgi:hypothetical protein